MLLGRWMRLTICSNIDRTYLLFFLVILVGCNDGRYKKYPIVIDDSVVDGISRTERKKLIQNINDAINDYTQYFDTTYRDTLHVYIFDIENMFAEKNRMYISKRHIESRFGIFHEVCHAVLGLKKSFFEMEGLAVFMANKYVNDENSEGEKLKRGYMNFFGKHRCDIPSLRYLMQKDELFYTYPSDCAYMQAGSFYQFLDDRFGRTKLKSFYMQGIDKIEVIYGVSIDSLDTLWRRWLFTENASGNDKSNNKHYPNLFGKSEHYKSFLEYKSDSTTR